MRALLQEEDLLEVQQAQLRQLPGDCVLIDIREEAEREAAGLPELKLGARYKVRTVRGDRRQITSKVRQATYRWTGCYYLITCSCLAICATHSPPPLCCPRGSLPR